VALANSSPIDTHAIKVAEKEREGKMGKWKRERNTAELNSRNHNSRSEQLYSGINIVAGLGSQLAQFA
jgi:hypothetical protein